MIMASTSSLHDYSLSAVSRFYPPHPGRGIELVAFLVLWKMEVSRKLSGF